MRSDFCRESQGGEVIVLVVDISVAAAAAAFVALVVCLIRTLRTAETSLRQMNETLKAVQKQLEETGRETDRLLHAVHRIAQDVQQKLDAADELFTSLRHAGATFGETLLSVARSLKATSAGVIRTISGAEKSVYEHRRTIRGAMEWAAAGIELCRTWHDRRREKNGAREEPKSRKGEEEHVGCSNE